MTRKEELKKLEEISNFLCNMSDDEFFKYFYEGSPSFRKDYDAIVNTLDSENVDSVVLTENAEYHTLYDGQEYSACDNTYQPMTLEDAECLTAA